MRTFESVQAFAQAVGHDLGSTSWLTIDEERVAAFIRATNKSQTRPETVPSLMVLSAVSPLLKELYDVENVTMRINYGLDSIRFTTPVPLGSRLRAIASLRVAEATEAGYRFTIRMLIEREGSDEPVASADVIAVLVR